MEINFPNARISGQNVIYLMKSNTCLIGRDINSKLDLTITTSPCISRVHLKIISKGNKLYLKCLGKNGIFINECFQIYTLEEVPLPAMSTIRFPSTNIELRIESKNYLMENCKKKYPLKKRLFIISKDIESVGFEDTYLSESSVDTTELSLQKIHRVQNQNDMMVHSPTDQGSETIKPPYSYAQLIIQAIVSGETQQMTLSEIYRFISKQFPYYKMNQKGWQNSIRHNLSLNRYFIRIPRSQNNCGKSAFWKLDKSQEAQLIKQAFWKRRMKNSYVVVDKPGNHNNPVKNMEFENYQLKSENVKCHVEVPDSNSSVILDQSTLSNDSLMTNNHDTTMSMSFDI